MKSMVAFLLEQKKLSGIKRDSACSVTEIEYYFILRTGLSM